MVSHGGDGVYCAPKFGRLQAPNGTRQECCSLVPQAQRAVADGPTGSINPRPRDLFFHDPQGAKPLDALCSDMADRRITSVRSIDVPAEKKRVQNIVEHIAKGGTTVRWRYSAHSNERFPLRLYASARRGKGLEAHDALVIAVELFNPADDWGDRLIVSADIMDEEGVILQQSPRYEVPLPPEDELLANPEKEIAAVTRRVRSSMKKIDQWLGSQAQAILAALA